MAVFLIKLVFSLVAALSSLLTRFVINGAAHVVVQIVQVVKIPSEGSQRVVDRVKDLITTCMKFLMGLMVGAVTSIFSSSFNFVTEGVLASSTGVVGAVAGMLEKSKASFEDALKDIPDVLEAFTKMVGNIIADFLNNCSQAADYVVENVF